MVTAKIGLFEMQELDDLDLLLYEQPDDDSENSEIMCHCMLGRETRLFTGAVPPRTGQRSFQGGGSWLEVVI